jgi:hypothetical protein
MKLQYYLFAALLSLCACTKNDLDDVISVGKGCIKQIATSSDAHGINKAEQAIAVRLFQQNNISLKDLRFTRFSEEDLVLDGKTNHYVHVHGTQYTSGLPVFTGELGYHFKDGKYYFLMGEKFTTTTDPKPALSLAQVRSLFFKEFINYNKQSTTYKAEDFKDKCLTTELGYYTFRGGEIPTRSVLSWHVKPKGEDYPEAYINDSESTIIYFFDGHWTFMPR